MGYKPEGYNSVAPYLLVNGAQRTIDFLAAVFDAVPLRMMAGENGTIRHGEVKIGDSVAMLADAVEGWPAIPSNIHVYVEDVDSTFAKALSHGAKAVQEPVQKTMPISVADSKSLVERLGGLDNRYPRA